MKDWKEKLKQTAKRNRVVRGLLIIYYVFYYTWRDFGRALLASRRFTAVCALVTVLLMSAMWISLAEAEIEPQINAGEAVSGNDAESGSVGDAGNSCPSVSGNDAEPGSVVDVGDSCPSVSGNDAKPGSVSDVEEPCTSVSGNDIESGSVTDVRDSFTSVSGNDAESGSVSDVGDSCTSANSNDAEPGSVADVEETHASANSDNMETGIQESALNREGQLSEENFLGEPSSEKALHNEQNTEPLLVDIPSEIKLQLNPWDPERQLISEPITITNHSAFDVDIVVENICITINHDGATDEIPKDCSITMEIQADDEEMKAILLQEGNSGELSVFRLSGNNNEEEGNNSVSFFLNGNISPGSQLLWKEGDIYVSIRLKVIYPVSG